MATAFRQAAVDRLEKRNNKNFGLTASDAALNDLVGVGPNLSGLGCLATFQVSSDRRDKILWKVAMQTSYVILDCIGIFFYFRVRYVCTYST